MVTHITECLCEHLIRLKPELLIGICGAKTVEEVAKKHSEICDFAFHASLCHDFGKVFVIDTIFVYGRNLLDMEFDIIKTHPEMGAQMLERYYTTAPYADVVRGNNCGWSERRSKMISENLLRKYAELIVRTGANVQPGQVVMLTVAVEQHEFAALIIEECYKAGAKKVNVNWTSDVQSRLDFLYAEQETLAKVLPWEEAKLQQMAEDLPCRIFVASEDPDAMSGVDPQKLSAVSQSRATVIKPYRDAIEGKHQWVIVGYPSEKWAKKCFPNDENAVELLWDAILKTVRVREDNDPVAEWHAHTAFIDEKAAWLNEQHFSSLKYKSSNGTDFTVELIPEANWEGAGIANSLNGAYYIPNMPTEEIFTSPLAGKCEGTLVSVKPLSWNSQVIENFSITFENGRAVSCKAEKGQELLEQMLKMDDGAAMLGEVALVPKESPVNQCGFLFYETLFDENACCHCAVGAGFKEVLEGGDDMTMEEAQKKGINDSIIHVDFMIGADDLSIDGIREDGTIVPVFRDGTWA